MQELRQESPSAFPSAAEIIKIIIQTAAKKLSQYPHPAGSLDG